MADLISKIKGVDNVTYDLQDKVSIFGGTNLLIGSKLYTKNNPFSYTSTAKDGYTYINTMLTSEPLISGQNYIIQCKTNGTWAASHGSQATSNVTLWLVTGATISENTFHYNFTTSGGAGTYLGNGQWKWTCPSGSNGLYGHIRINNYNTDGTTSVTHTYWDFKIEKGNKPTEWTPAPQDLVTYSSETLEFFQ